MKCQNQIIHTIQKGDTLYALARKYNTTVTRLLQLNPNVEVYNLQIGSGLTICPGEDFAPVYPENPATPTPTLPPVFPTNPIFPTPTVPPTNEVAVREILRELIAILKRLHDLLG